MEKWLCVNIVNKNSWGRSLFMYWSIAVNFSEKLSFKQNILMWYAFTITRSKFNVFKKIMRHCEIVHFATLNVCTSQLSKTLTTVKQHLAIKETSSNFCHFLSFHSLTFWFSSVQTIFSPYCCPIFVGKQATMDFWMHPSVDKTAIAWVFVNPYTSVHPWCRTTIFWHYCSRDEIECPLRFWICTHVIYFMAERTRGHVVLNQHKLMCTISAA